MLVVDVGGWNDGAAVVEGRGVVINAAAVGRGVAIDGAVLVGGMAMSEAIVEGRMDVDGEAVCEEAARLRAMDVAVGLGGVVMDVALGLDGAAMDVAVKLDLGMAIGLAVVQGQTRRITTVAVN